VTDFKEQLAEIRSLVKKADYVAGDASHQHREIKDHTNKDWRSLSSSSEGSCISILPLLGKIDNYDPSRAFGFISSKSGNLFFHLTDRISGTTINLEGDIQKYPVMYITGSSPKDGRTRAARWCFVDDIDWPSGKVPDTQKGLDSIRKKWIELLTIEQILEILKADWYRKYFKKNNLVADLQDPILQDMFTRKLSSANPDEWRQLHVKERLQQSMYVFARSWSSDSDEYSAQDLVNNFTIDQLVAFGKPKYEWFGLCEAEYEAKLFEWALSSDLDDSHRLRWEEELQDDYPWYDGVASSLISGDWIPSKAEIQWIQKLIRANRLSPALIIDRLKNYPSEKELWFDFLPDEQKVMALAYDPASTGRLIALLRTKNDAQLNCSALLHRALSLDLESDGKDIWEIGVADVNGIHLLLSRDDPSEKSAGSLEKLEKKIDRASLLVGHNILKWDWPILVGRLSNRHYPIIWDTLLVDYLLEPWKASHALGSTHHAHDDANASFELFEKQLHQFDGELFLRILEGEFENNAKFYLEIGSRLRNAEWDLPKGPTEVIQEVDSDEDIGKVYVLPSYLIKEFDWVPNVLLTTADREEPENVVDLIVDADRLVAELSSHKSTAIENIVLQALLQKAHDERVYVRFGTLPLWIRESPEVADAIRVSLVQPKTDNAALKIARYPRGTDWYKDIDTKRYRLVSPPQSATLVDSQWLRGSDLPPRAREYFIENVSDGAPKDGSVYLWELKKNPGVSLWVTLDPVAKRLSKNGNCWRILNVVDFRGSVAESTLPPPSESCVKPTLLTHRQTALFPGTEDQAAYWKDTLSGFLHITKDQPLGSVTLLLVGSSCSRELMALLNDILAELGHTAVAKSYQGRSDQLARTARIKGGAIVDLLDNWEIWRSLAENAGIPITPAIEALPIIDWYVTRHQKETQADLVAVPDAEASDLDEDDIDLSSDEDEDGYDYSSQVASPRVDASRINSTILELIADNLRSWLWQTRLSICQGVPIILDTRVNSRSKEVRQYFDVIQENSNRFDPVAEQVIDLHFELLQIARETAPKDYETLRLFLEKHWNHGKKEEEPGWIFDFRQSSQRPAIDEIRERKADVLVTLPTGEGKSVLFQVPALFYGLRTRRLTLVISPLRALMRDQVEKLWGQGFHQSADYLSADRPAHDIDGVLQGVLDHRIVLLYVAPERFRSKRFMDVIERRFDSDGAFEYVVVDETHCVNQWGYDFRPDYFYAINVICQKFRRQNMTEKTPFILLSATVTASSRNHLSNLIKGDGVQDERYLPFEVRPEKYFHPIRSHISINAEHVLGWINAKPKSDWPIVPRLEIIQKLINEAKENRKRTQQHSSIIIFVSRRDHAEKMSFLIESKDIAQVDYFHAGLDAGTRSEVYERFKKGDIEVLVATKAFGMGMDIPHIHWAVHLVPPSFLEDYLQEVGRIGRGEKERQLAQLTSLQATLLYSDDDFQVNRENVLRGRIELPQISELYSQIVDVTHDVDGLLVAMIPDSGFGTFRFARQRRAASTQIRKTLYWLERLDLIKILSIMPGLLPVTLSVGRLLEIAEKETGPIADVATSLASLEQRSSSEGSHNSGNNLKSGNEDQGIIEKVLDGISDFVGFLFGGNRGVVKTTIEESQKPKNEIITDVTDTGSYEAIINLGQVWRDTVLPHVDDVLSAIADLEMRNALKISRRIGFSRGRFSYANVIDVEQLFEYLDKAAASILSKLKDQAKYVIDFEDISSGFPDVWIGGELFDVRVVMERSVCFLLRSAGVQIRERLVAEEARELTAILSKSKYWIARGRIKSVVLSSQGLWKVFIPKLELDEKEIEVSTLLECNRSFAPNKRFREWDLRRCLGLLGSLRLVNVSEPLVPMSYLLSVVDSTNIPNREENPEVWRELEEVNRLNELRLDAMEIFVHLPISAQSEFIEGYFTKKTPEDMEVFLDEQVRLVEEDVEGAEDGFIQKKLSHIRATAVEEYFSRFRLEAEEPNQWLAITHPFDRHLLINAGPGSGKTSVLIARIAHLVRNQNLRPEEVLVLAFNRAVVFEIRSRIRALFTQLGYGAYVRRLNVYTFHAFATLHLGNYTETDDWKTDREKLLSIFAERLETDSAFRMAVSGGFRAILIDEFQDMNKELFRILKAISSGAGIRPGVMGIGDDDQDILRWNRSAGESSGAYFKKFVEKYSLDSDAQLDLKVNYRSGQKIVNETQKFLNEYFERHEGGAGRLKNARLFSSRNAPASEVLAYELDTGKTQLSVQGIINSCGVLSTLRDADSTALLCRTNNEVARVYNDLCRHVPGLRIQNNVSYPIVRLRHIAIWSDILKSEMESTEDRPLTSELFGELLDNYSKIKIPEVLEPRPEDITPIQLWELCLKERSYLYLSHLIEFIGSLDSDDVARLLRQNDSTGSALVVSTIHKVKGLEFDNVVIVPSSASFPLDYRVNAQAAHGDAGEEARLFYVGMTRAKRRLCYHMGPRELSWSNGKCFLGESGGGKILSGKPDEIGISWAWESSNWNSDATALQAYIEREVRVGDRLELGGVGRGAGRGIFHCAKNGSKRQIGFTSNQVGVGNNDSDLLVSAVFRCLYDGDSYFGGSTSSQIVQQGWGLVVLASGVLR